MSRHLTLRGMLRPEVRCLWGSPLGSALWDSGHRDPADPASCREEGRGLEVPSLCVSWQPRTGRVAWVSYFRPHHPSSTGGWSTAAPWQEHSAHGSQGKAAASRNICDALSLCLRVSGPRGGRVCGCVRGSESGMAA